MNVLFVSDVYPPIIGGAELQTQMLARKFNQRGHTVSVATSWQPTHTEYEEENGLKIFRLKGLSSMVPWFSVNPNRRHHPPFPDPATVIGLRRVLRAVEPDVVHSYGWISYSLATALVGSKTPLILAMREYAHTCALRTMLHNGKVPCSGPESAKCFRCASHFFGTPKGIVATTGVSLGKRILRSKVRGVHNISGYMRHIAWRDLFADNNPNSEIRLGQKNCVIADAIIPSMRDEGQEQRVEKEKLETYLRQLPTEPFIMFVGALRRVKGLDALVQAYAKLRNAPKLVLLGVKTPDTPESFPAGTQVLYHFPQYAVMAAWERAMFGVFPSLWPEPFGNVVHEAMSKGKPTIGTTPGGHTDIILDGETGYLVTPGDVDALAHAMQQLIDSPALREKMGVAAKERAQLFDSKTVIPQFELFFEDVIEKSKRAIR
jgi:glycosyltransferase involved in cell wall biosynthesis